jgi:16S rRNA (uracil1498-N3)-methyltransferase
MHRFFVPGAALSGSEVILRENQAHQVSNVLRLRSGEHISLFDDSGWEYLVRLVRVNSSHCSGEIVERRLVDNEPRVKITIYQALLKGSKFDLIVQKGVEMGVAGFVPVLCARSVMGDIHQASEKKAERWRRIAIEAAEQSGRSRLPMIHPGTLFARACEQTRGLSLMAWESERKVGLQSVLAEKADLNSPSGRPLSVNLFVGPEGGFTSDEVTMASDFGITPVSLGPRILRSETAALAFAAVVLYHFGDLG